ncbi:MAG: low affinity iron permease family protein, partial [Blastocatellia bacterium]
WTGSSWAFALAILTILVWACSYPLFGPEKFDTWQLVINTGTTIITFLMVFLIQNTQNRDAKALHLKLDELIASLKAAHNEMISIEDLSDEQLEEIAAYYRQKKEGYPEDTVAAIATDVAKQTAHETAYRVAGDTAGRVADDTAKRVAGDTAREVADETAKRTVKDHKRHVA